MCTQTQRREKWHEEHIRNLGIRYPNCFQLHLFSLPPFVQQISHHPILHTVLFPQPGLRRPRRKGLRRHRSIVGTPATQHSHVEFGREIVHVDPQWKAWRGF
uniref:Uncharacterized protein n=1 Tax=Opuntia streptacantha TaxID=393608 RepID=A0A7C9AWH6_OPUST